MIDILEYFPKNLRTILYDYIGQTYSELEEIRIRNRTPYNS